MKPPPFSSYYATTDDMDGDQLRFYSWLAAEIDAGGYPPVHGQISYLFAYTYTQLARSRRRGFEWAHARLVEIAEAYWQEPKFASYCMRWATDCLLGVGDYARYLEVTEPEALGDSAGHQGNLRANVAEHLGLRPHPFDVLSFFVTGTTTHTRRNLGAYRHHLDAVFVEYEAELGKPLLQHLREVQGNTTYRHTLFQGAPIDQPLLALPYYCFYGATAEGERIRHLAREAENRLRDALKLPRVGQGWIAETALFRTVADAFPQTAVVQHGRPPWLGRQHLDIWLPRWKVAVEYHGAQHFQPVEFFGGEAAYEANVERDTRKAALCAANGVTLIVATEVTPTAEVLAHVAAARRTRPTAPAPDTPDPPNVPPSQTKTTPYRPPAGRAPA